VSSVPATTVPQGTSQIVTRVDVLVATPAREAVLD
jgi:hypothetical protein